MNSQVFLLELPRQQKDRCILRRKKIKNQSRYTLTEMWDDYSKLNRPENEKCNKQLNLTRAHLVVQQALTLPFQL